MRVAGIDVGKTGAIAVVEAGQLIFVTMLNPVLEMGSVGALLRAWQVKIAYVEKAQAMPGQGVSSVFTYGQGFGEIVGTLKALKIPFVLVSPRKWTTWAHQGCSAGTPKARSAEAAQRLFPGQSFVPGNCKKPSDGMIDAALIAVWGEVEHLKQSADIYPLVRPAAGSGGALSEEAAENSVDAAASSDVHASPN
jgi:crossover junction endodeoxyribonuclease RuvC